MCDHVANGNIATISRNLGNGVKEAIKRLSQASSTGNSPDHTHITIRDSSDNNKQLYLKGPQISVEDLDADDITNSKENTAYTDPSTVQWKKKKSHSLPAGSILEDKVPSSDEMNSDLSDEMENTPPEIDSSLEVDKDCLSVSGTRSKVKHNSLLRHTESVTSSLSVMESDISSDEANYLEEGKMDDEVFGNYGKVFDPDMKLVEWANKEFVPSCQSLLEFCSQGSEKLEQIKSQLRDLSNRILYFSSEQQQLSVQRKSSTLRGITSSISTDQFNRFSTLMTHPTASLISNSSESPSLSSRGSGEPLYEHRSYAMKVLRSVSQELIEPLLKDVVEYGFTTELYQAIVQAIQKIAWKVEACLSYNDPTKHFLIHHEIFPPTVIEKVKDMMIRASPSVGRRRSSSTSETNSNFSTPQRRASVDNIDPQRVVKRSPSGRIRPAGTVFNSETLPEDFEVTTNKDTPPALEINEGSTESCPVQTAPKLFRSQTTTICNEETNSRPLSRYNSSPFLEKDDFPELTDTTPGYLRPTKPRRTTVSLSRNEVTRLGLTVTKHVEETIVTDLSGSSAEHEAHSNELEEQRIKLHAQLTETFDKIRERSSSNLKAPYERNKSASMSDLLDDSPACPHNTKRHSSKTSLNNHQPPNSLGLKGYVSMPPQVSDSQTVIDDDWVHLPRPEVDPQLSRNQRSSLVNNSTSKPKGKKNKKNKSSEKNKQSDKISTSGRFTESLRKTALALRRMSVSTHKPGKSGMISGVEVGSLDMLAEIDKDLTSSPSSMSEPSSPSTTKPRVHTMPNHKRKIGTLFKSNKHQSKSFSKGDTVARKRKSQPKSGFLDYQGELPADTGESIDLQYSKQVDITTVQQEAEKELLITVNLAGKQSTKGKKISTSSGWFELSVLTNIKQFGRNHYTILRTLKQVQNLFDELQTTCSVKLSERPDKKKDIRRQCQQIQDLFRFICGNPTLRDSSPLVMFLMPDDAFGTFTETDSEVNFDLIMTFYTPDQYLGDPGSHRDVDVVLPEDAPRSVSPVVPHRGGGTLKRGTMRVVRNEEEGSTFIIREEDKDALIVACEDKRYVVVAGTFEKLVEQLAGDEKPDHRFVSTLLLGYRHFATPVELLTGLLGRFHLELPPNATDEEIVYAEKWRYMIQLRVLDILTYWIKKCWPDFYRNQEVLDMTKQFIADLKAAKDSNFNLAGTNLEKMVTEKSESSPRMYSLLTPPTPRTPKRRPSTPTTPIHTPSTPPQSPSTRGEPSTPSPRVGGRSRRHPVDISTLTAIQLARQFTLIELDFLKLITTHELAVYTWEPNTPENKPYRKNLDNFIARFNKVSYWVASEICTVKDAKTRGALIEKFIEIAKQCQEHRNFNTTVSLVGGLSLAAVRRLKKSWEFVSEKSVKAYQKLTLLTSPSNNHGNYRKLFAGVHRRDVASPYGCIPYFGVFIRDLTFFNDGNAKRLKNGLINFSKLRTMVLKFEELKRYQRSKYFFPPEDRTREFCKNLWSLSESDLYEASYQVEPREAPPIETDI